MPAQPNTVQKSGVGWEETLTICKLIWKSQCLHEYFRLWAFSPGYRGVSKISVRLDMSHMLRYFFSCAQRGYERGMRLKRDTLVLGQFVCILANLVPVSSWIHSSQYCRGAQHLMWVFFCSTWCKSKCREGNGFLMLQTIFGGRKVSGLHKLPCCSARGLSRGLWGMSIWLFGLQPGFWPGQTSFQGPGWVNSGPFVPLRQDLGQVSCCLLLSSSLLREEIRRRLKHGVPLWMAGTCLGRVAETQTYNDGSARGKDQRLWDPQQEAWTLHYPQQEGSRESKAISFAVPASKLALPQNHSSSSRSLCRNRT